MQHIGDFHEVFEAYFYLTVFNSLIVTHRQSEDRRHIRLRHYRLTEGFKTGRENKHLSRHVCSADKVVNGTAEIVSNGYQAFKRWGAFAAFIGLPMAHINPKKRGSLLLSEVFIETAFFDANFEIFHGTSWQMLKLSIYYN